MEKFEHNYLVKRPWVTKKNQLVTHRSLKDFVTKYPWSSTELSLGSSWVIDKIFQTFLRFFQVFREKELDLVVVVVRIDLPKENAYSF